MTGSGAHHFFVAPDEIGDDTVKITGAEAHHAVRVLRLRPGESISVADGTGRVVDAVVKDVGDVVRADVLSVHEETWPTPAITLVQAVPKGDRMDDVITKAVEIGVANIVPFVAERTVVRWEDAKRRKALQRWSVVARAAAKQCRSARLTAIGEVRTSATGVADSDVFVLHEGAGKRLRDALPTAAPETVTFVVGPEGGLTEAELESLGSEGATVVTLGDRILRTETAGLVAVTIAGFAYGNLG